MSSFILRLSICASLVYANAIPDVADPTITPAAELKRQDDQRFMGWLSYQGTWTSRNCDIGGYWYQSGDYAGCCGTAYASCNFPIGCVDGSLIYSFTTGSITTASYACNEIYTDPADAGWSLCNTGFIYENTDDSSPQTDIFCGSESVNWSYYRVIATSTSSSRSSSTSTPTPGPTTTPTPTPTPSPSPSPSPTPAPKSKAWIAGVVIGPVALIAIVGLGIWIFMLKKRQGQIPPPVANQPMQQQPTYPPGPPPAQSVGQAYNPYPTATPTSPVPGYTPGVAAGAWGSEQKPTAQPHVAPVSEPRAFASEMWAGQPEHATGQPYPPPAQSPPPHGAH